MEKAEEIGDDLAARIGMRMGAPDAPSRRAARDARCLT